ncbi:MAG: type II toxin-antitoxin system MqsA family antitoxin [Cloacibacillus sp.]
MCKGNMEDKETTFMTEIEGTIIIVKNVPSQVCVQCGEISYSDAVASELEKIVSSLRNGMTEITVVNFKDAA